MKKYRFTLLAVLVAMLAAVHTLRAQSGCYVRLADASGYTPTAGQLDALEQAAAALCAVFDSAGFGGQFKVYDFGFYQHHETTAGGYPEPFARKVAEVAALSPYYLLFGKQSDRSGVYTRFWVEARLPDSLSFRFPCLDTIGARILRTSLDLTANIEYEALGKMPFFYHLAEIRVMNRLKAEVDKLRECCYYQQRGLSTCDAPCLTSDETKKLLEQLGFTAIPIKILGPTQAKSADGQRPAYNRVTDCAELDIEMDGVEYHDFAGTINNIMSVYQDSTVRAEILDEECLCQGGVQYLIHTVKNKTIILTIVIWNNPIDPLESRMYTFHKYPDLLGVLPFKGHFPNKLGNQETLALDMNYIMNTVNTIYQKNGFSLNSIDFDDIEILDEFDLYNKIIRIDNSPQGGFSRTDDNMISDKTNMINYWQTTLQEEKSKLIKNANHRNYIVGIFVGHEFLHQIISKCSLYLNKVAKPNKIIYDHDGGHCRFARNLMYPGDGLDRLNKEVMNEYKIKWNNHEQKYLNIPKTDIYPRGHILYCSGHFYPSSNTAVFNEWESITSTFKKIIGLFLIFYEVEKEYGIESNEFCCAKKIFISHEQIYANY